MEKNIIAQRANSGSTSNIIAAKAFVTSSWFLVVGYECMAVVDFDWFWNWNNTITAISGAINIESIIKGLSIFINEIIDDKCPIPVL